jgi:hypothetical protein
MTLYVATPTSLFRFRFDLLADGETVGGVEHRLWGRAGWLAVGGVESEIRRTGPRAYEVVPEVSIGHVAARPLGVFAGSHDIVWKDGSIKTGRLGLGYGLRIMRDGAEAGTVRLRNLFTRTMVVDVPSDTPVEAVALLVYLIVRLRRRAIPASGGAA